MKNKLTVLGLSTALILVLGNIPVAFAQDPVGNQVGVELTHGSWHSTDEDSIDNVPIEWSHQWFFNIMNTPDGGDPVLNPIIDVRTDLNLVRFRPDDSAVFSVGPNAGQYVWNFNGLQVDEPAHLGMSAFESEDPIVAKTRFAASRSVEPETLTETFTEQTVTVIFRLLEPLPLDATHLQINIGSPVIAYGGAPLVQGLFVSQVPVEGWNSGTDGVSASWSINREDVEIGRTYEFQATLESVKSTDLLGSPLFKPGVLVLYSRGIGQSPETDYSVTIKDPDNTVSATYSAGNVVDWSPFFSDTRFDFWFNPVVSEITPPPPPFHVLVPAGVRIEPESLHLQSKGVLTAFVNLPEEYSVEDIMVSTATTATTATCETCETCDGASAIRGEIADNTLILQFNRQDLQDVNPGEEVEFLVCGELADQSIFEGVDVIRVIDPVSNDED